MISPEKKKAVARECLRQLWQTIDAGGESHGRSLEARYLECALALLGPPDRNESAAADANKHDYLIDAESLAREAITDRSTGAPR